MCPEVKAGARQEAGALPAPRLPGLMVERQCLSAGGTSWLRTEVDWDVMLMAVCRRG